MGCTALKNVTYTGTTADWKALTIYSGNEALTRANVRCTGSTVLTAPTLTLSVSKKGQPTLKWNAVSGAAGYQIWCSYDSGDGTGPWYHWLTNLDKRTASFTDDRELEKGRTYTYKVRAVTSSGAVGSFSKEVTFTYNPAASLAAPTVTAGLDDQGYPALTWPAVPDAARYEVYRAASEDGNFAQLAAVTSNSYTNSAVLTDGAAYYYKVRALDSDGEAGPFSETLWTRTQKADHETGAADNKLRLNTEHRKSARCSACFVVRGFQRGFPFGTRLCSQSVVCYTLCRRCCENAVAAGEGKGIFTAGKQGCDCVAWSRKRRTGFISRQGVYECPRPSSYAELWDKVSQTDSHTYEKADGFFSQN